MEITSFGLASKAASDLKRIRKDMGNNVTSSYANVKERLDQVEKDIEAAYKLTDEIIVNNAINIAKAEAKINTIANATKFDFEQMIFDDLFDLTNIDMTTNSPKHDSYYGWISLERGESVITKDIVFNKPVTKVLITMGSAQAIALSESTGADTVNDLSVVPKLTSNNQDGFVVTASSCWGDMEQSSWSPWRAFDSYVRPTIDQDRWATAYSSGTGWIQVKLKEPKKIVAYDLYPNTNSGTADQNIQNPKSWKLLGSNDGSSWVELDSQILKNWTSVGIGKMFKVKKPGEYQYYRLNVTATFGSDIVSIGEIKLKDSTMISQDILNQQILNPTNLVITANYQVEYSIDKGITWNNMAYEELVNIKPCSEIRFKLTALEKTNLSYYSIIWS